VANPYDAEPEGGDPACWAHLFADELYGTHEGVREIAVPASGGNSEPEVVDLVAMTRSALEPGTAWAKQSDDLNVNLVVFTSGNGVSEHVNTEVDVLLVGVSGEGVVEVDGTAHRLRAGHALVIPKGARRGTRAESDAFAYLTCHRRRGGLLPSR
jgi:quercetin dioxygenase-like cupin family protein